MDTGDLRQLPVVSRARPGRLVGLLSRGDIIAAYSGASASRDADGAMPPLGAPRVTSKMAEFVEIRVRDSSPAVGQYVRDLAIPKGCSLIHIIRHDEEVIPRGDDLILAGDTVTAISLPEVVREVERVLGGERTYRPKVTADRAISFVSRVRAAIP